MVVRLYSSISTCYCIVEACGDIGEVGDITFLPFRYETVLN